MKKDVCNQVVVSVLISYLKLFKAPNKNKIIVVLPLNLIYIIKKSELSLTIQIKVISYENDSRPENFDYTTIFNVLKHSGKP